MLVERSVGTEPRRLPPQASQGSVSLPAIERCLQGRRNVGGVGISREIAGYDDKAAIPAVLSGTRKFQRKLYAVKLRRDQTLSHRNPFVVTGFVKGPFRSVSLPRWRSRGRLSFRG